MKEQREYKDKTYLKERIFLTSVGVNLQVRGPEFGPQ